MHIRQGVLTPLIIALVIIAAVWLAPVLAQQQQPQKVDKKVDQGQKFDIQQVVNAADAAKAGNVAGDIAASFRFDFLKAQEGRTYVPFTVTIAPDDMPASRSLNVFVRVVNKAIEAAPPAPAAAKKDSKDAKNQPKNAHPEYVFQQLYLLNPPAAAPGQPYRISRAFAVPAGEYDVYVVIKERLPYDAKDREKTPTKTGAIKQAVTVPNYWTAELVTSTVILAEKVEGLSQPLTRQEAEEQPYTFGMTQIVPASSPKLPKKGELSIVFLVYNTGLDANKKPDVAIEYAFYQKVADAEKGEKFFNKTNPQVFSAATLPPQFDPALGHQLVAGQSVPLGSFPEGEYRLEVKITDKLTGKTLTQNIQFFVAA